MSNHLSSIIRILKAKGNNSWSLRTITNSCESQDPEDITTTYTTQSIRSFVGNYKNDEIDNSTIKMSDIKLYVEPTGIDSINTTDKITDGTSVYTIIDIRTWYDRDTLVLYILRLRK